MGLMDLTGWVCFFSGGKYPVDARTSRKFFAGFHAMILRPAIFHVKLNSSTGR
jgi:hypothetical protein